MFLQVACIYIVLNFVFGAQSLWIGDIFCEESNTGYTETGEMD